VQNTWDANDDRPLVPQKGRPRSVQPTQTGQSLAAFREEAKKCVLVCANCHGEIEAGLIASPPAGTQYRDRLAG
jgi:cytochrome c553